MAQRVHGYLVADEYFRPGSVYATNTVLHLCSHHLHTISCKLEKKFKIDKRLNIVMHVFGCMVNCGQVNGIS